VQRLVSVVKMVTVLEECPTEEQSSVVHFFYGQKDSMKRISIKKGFLFMVRSVCHVKWFTTQLRNSLKDVQKSQMMPNQVQKWLR
jgi:Tat protein secretion system quality control protein TatD with DNase activity